MGGALLSRSLTRGNGSALALRGTAGWVERGAAMDGVVDVADEDEAAGPDTSVLGPPR